MFDNLQNYFNELSELINRYNEQRIIIDSLNQEIAKLKAQLAPAEDDGTRP